eukprot:1891039-Alexandrium_andersonii.AAC.1
MAEDRALAGRAGCWAPAGSGCFGCPAEGRHPRRVARASVSCLRGCVAVRPRAGGRDLAEAEVLAPPLVADRRQRVVGPAGTR